MNEEGGDCPNADETKIKKYGFCPPFEDSNYQNECAWYFQQFCSYETKKKYMEAICEGSKDKYFEGKTNEEKEKKIKEVYDKIGKWREAVSKEIRENFNTYSTRLQPPQEKHVEVNIRGHEGRFIGEGGKTIRMLELESGCIVRIIKGSGCLHMTGSHENIEKCLVLVHEVFDEIYKSKQNNTVETPMENMDQPSVRNMDQTNNLEEGVATMTLNPSSEENRKKTPWQKMHALLMEMKGDDKNVISGLIV